MNLSEALLSWHDVAEEPRLICARNGDVVWINAAAQNYVKHKLSHQKAAAAPLAIWQSMMAAGLFSEILKVADTCPAGKMRSVPYGQATNQEVIFFKVFPLSPYPEAPIAITVAMSQKLTPESRADLRAIYGLSGAELRILSDLIDGKTLSDSALSTNTSILTVRTQVRSIYQKLGVSSREAMFNLLAPLL